MVTDTILGNAFNWAGDDLKKADSSIKAGTKGLLNIAKKNLNLLNPLKVIDKGSDFISEAASDIKNRDGKAIAKKVIVVGGIAAAGTFVVAVAPTAIVATSVAHLGAFATGGAWATGALGATTTAGTIVGTVVAANAGLDLADVNAAKA